MVGPEAPIDVTLTPLAAPEYRLLFGVEEPSNDVLAAAPGNGSPVSPRFVLRSRSQLLSAWTSATR